MAVFIGTGSRGLMQVTSSVDENVVRRMILAEFMPEVGSVKYLARANPVRVDISSDGFDGWVYADGALYKNSDFPSAAAVFGTKYGGSDEEFAVPDLRRFAKPCYGQPEIRFVPASAYVPLHCHDIDTKISYSSDHILSAAFTIAQTGTRSHVVGRPPSKSAVNLGAGNYKAYVEGSSAFNGYVPGFHGGDDKTTQSDHQVMTDLNIPAGISFAVVGTGGAGSSPLSAYPAHVTLQVMVYIGRRPY